MCSNGLCCRDCKVNCFYTSRLFNWEACCCSLRPRLTLSISISLFHPSRIFSVSGFYLFFCGCLCQYELRGVTCRDAVNDCDIPETCTGDSSQVKEAPPTHLCIYQDALKKCRKSETQVDSE